MPRHLQAIERRDRAPASALWQTEAGRAWLIRLVGATLVMFGLKRRVGAETLSALCRRRRLAAHVGGSPSALRTVMPRLERLLLETAAAWEQAGLAHGEIRPGIGAVDETCRQRRMLVLMALAPGDVLLEAVATDRSCAPWGDRAHDRLTPLGPEGLSLVSDRAKALRKRAHPGLRCPRLPEVVPRGHALAPGYALPICGRLRHTNQGLAQATQRLET